VVHAAIRLMVPLLLAAVGALFTERAGVLNIALEGLMLFGAFTGVVTAAHTGSIAIGLLVAAATTGVLAFLYGTAALRLRADIFVAGIATNLLASGLTTVLADRILGYKGVVRFEAFPALPVMVPAAALAGLGPAGALVRIVLDQNLLVPLAWLLAALAWVALERTPFGLRLEATGTSPEVAASAGLDPLRHRIAAITVSGIACGAAGAALTLNLQAFVPNVTAGRGWIALVIVYLGQRRIAGVVIASFVFALAESFSNYSQGFLALPSQIVLAFPYALSLVALVGYSIVQARRRAARE
jgi:general nucleoside transport system permease protein